MFRGTIFTAAIIFTVFLNFACQMSSSARVSGAQEPAAQPAEDTKNGAATPVLVELFTSEGCSSCPPADRALMFLEKEQPVSGAQIVALEMHVDYWDDKSWKDPFSSAIFTERQNLYARTFRSGQIYTPQMIVDGASVFVGSDTLKATNTIMDASKKAKAGVTLALDQEKLKIKIDGLPGAKDSTVFLALTENNLDTDIKGGENSGKKLFHSAVARDLKAIGNISADSKTFETETDLQPDKAWKRNDLKAVVFIQENESRKILGIGQLSLAK